MAEAMSGASRNFGTGAFGNARVPYQNVDSPVELSAEEMRAAYEAAVKEDHHAQDILARSQTADIFIAGTPAYKDTPSNAKLMTSTLTAKYGDICFTQEMYQNVYQHLQASGLLDLNQAELAKERKAAAKQKFDAEKRRIETTRFDPNKDYDSLSLEEIKNLAFDAAKEEMQKAGERGGNGF